MLDRVQQGEVAKKHHTQLRGSYGYRPRHLEALVRLVESGRLDLSRSISGRAPLEDANETVDALATKRGNPIRLVLEP